MAGLAAGLPAAGREREKPGKTESFLAGAIAWLGCAGHGAGAWLQPKVPGSWRHGIRPGRRS